MSIKGKSFIVSNSIQCREHSNWINRQRKIQENGKTTYKKQKTVE